MALTHVSVSYRGRCLVKKKPEILKISRQGPFKNGALFWQQATVWSVLFVYVYNGSSMQLLV
jgi:hypothetical protein